MFLYNTLTRKKEEFKPITPGEVKMYSCGPTVYNYFHIGNARPFIIFDVLRRYLEYCGYKVTFVQNFTDIDDKVINKASQEGVAYSDIADRYIKEYFTDAEGLGVRHATYHPKATDCIDDIINLVKTLVEKGYAYESNGDVYYRTRKFAEYGKLSHQSVDELEAGARIDVNEQKEDPLDFAVWKAAKPGEPSWDSPWGKGRPGWHIECSAMANRYLGKTIDIHSGGVDLCFPHHENEIAQSEAANGVKFCNYWLHNGHITVDNKKMSKSAGNFFMTRDAAKAYGYGAVRLFMLSVQYRNPMNYSEESLKQSAAALERIQTMFENISFAKKNAQSEKASDAEQAALRELEKYRTRFKEAMDDDLNTADAISVIFDMVREVNGMIVGKQPSAELCDKVYGICHELCDVLGIPENRDTAASGDDAEINALIEKRTQARKERNFAEADRIRDELTQRGIVIEDTAGGVKWHRK